MQFFSPERPRAKPSDRPTFINHRAVLPGIYAQPDELEGHFLISVFLPVSNDENAFALKQKVVSSADLLAFLSAYRENPETALADMFAWDAKAAGKPKVQNQGHKEQSTLDLPSADLI